MCDEWKSNPQAFIDWAYSHGYDDTLTIDRINVNGNYEPSNCRWATVAEQNINKGMQRNNTSGVKGVRWNQWINKWTASIRTGGVLKHLGRFDTKEAAIEARKQGEIKYWHKDAE
jgi:hypothetical protein